MYEVIRYAAAPLTQSEQLKHGFGPSSD